MIHTHTLIKLKSESTMMSVSSAAISLSEVEKVLPDIG